jgi:hypothetical protein
MSIDTTTDQTLLGAIEPDVAAHLVSRREAIRQGATVSGGVAAALALGSVPVALAALSKEAGAQTGTVTDVLNFALALEIFENEFYKAVLGTSSSAAQNTAFNTVRGLVPAAVIPSLQKIQQHEASHVAFLQSQGATNVFNLSATTFDFTGARGAGNGPFARATTDLAFLLLVAQAAEDTGVRAYKGQAANLQSNGVALEAALRIHSVEARHAAKIRRLRRATGAPSTVRYSGTVSGSDATAAGADNVANPPAGAVTALGLIYAGEGSTTTQGGVNLTTLPNLPAGINVAQAAAEAFDEPLTRAQVVAIVQPFFIPTIA